MPILPKFTKILLIFITLTILGCSIFLNIYLLNSKETSNETSNDLTNLDLSNDYLQNQLQLTSNSEPIKSFAYTDPNKPLKQILKVARLSQLPDYPNGCEATSATMLLNYYGINITLSQFIDDYLPQKGVYLKDNLRYGPNPALYYAGDPSSQENGWGCYEPVIENSLKTIIKDNSANFKVLNLTNQNLSTLESYLPVVIWTTIDYEKVGSFYLWFDPQTNEPYTYASKTHAVLLIGYDKDYYYLNDPLKAKSVFKISKEELQIAYDAMGRQAVTIKKED